MILKMNVDENVFLHDFLPIEFIETTPSTRLTIARKHFTHRFVIDSIRTIGNNNVKSHRFTQIFDSFRFTST